MDDDGDNGELRVRSADGAAESKCDVFKKKKEGKMPIRAE